MSVIGLLLLPESPRYFVKCGDYSKAQATLARVRGQPESSEYIKQELAEIVANHEYEKNIIGEAGYIQGWLNCFSGSLRNPSSNIRRTLVATSSQALQQVRGIFLIFYHRRLTNLSFVELILFFISVLLSSILLELSAILF